MRGYQLLYTYAFPFSHTYSLYILHAYHNPYSEYIHALILSPMQYVHNTTYPITFIPILFIFHVNFHSNSQSFYIPMHLYAYYALLFIHTYPYIAHFIYIYTLIMNTFLWNLNARKSHHIYTYNFSSYFLYPYVLLNSYHISCLIWHHMINRKETSKKWQGTY